MNDLSISIGSEADGKKALVKKQEDENHFPPFYAISSIYMTITYQNQHLLQTFCFKLQPHQEWHQT
jgi:hypothetical protein